MLSWWRWTAAALAAVVVASLSVAVTASTRPAVSRGQVEEIVRESSPYAQDRQLIVYRLNEIAARLALIERRLDTFDAELRRLESRPPPPRG